MVFVSPPVSKPIGSAPGGGFLVKNPTGTGTVVATPLPQSSGGGQLASTPNGNVIIPRGTPGGFVSGGGGSSPPQNQQQSTPQQPTLTEGAAAAFTAQNLNQQLTDAQKVALRNYYIKQYAADRNVNIGGLSELQELNLIRDYNADIVASQVAASQAIGREAISKANLPTSSQYSLVYNPPQGTTSLEQARALSIPSQHTLAALPNQYLENFRDKIRTATTPEYLGGKLDELRTYIESLNKKESSLQKADAQYGAYFPSSTTNVPQRVTIGGDVSTIPQFRSETIYSPTTIFDSVSRLVEGVAKPELARAQQIFIGANEKLDVYGAGTRDIAKAGAGLAIHALDVDVENLNRLVEGVKPYLSVAAQEAQRETRLAQQLYSEINLPAIKVKQAVIEVGAKGTNYLANELENELVRARPYLATAESNAAKAGGAAVAAGKIFAEQSRNEFEILKNYADRNLSNAYERIVLPTGSTIKNAYLNVEPKIERGAEFILDRAEQKFEVFTDRLTGNIEQANKIIVSLGKLAGEASVREYQTFSRRAKIIYESRFVQREINTDRDFALRLEKGIKDNFKDLEKGFVAGTEFFLGKPVIQGLEYLNNKYQNYLSDIEIQSNVARAKRLGISYDEAVGLPQETYIIPAARGAPYAIPIIGTGLLAIDSGDVVKDFLTPGYIDTFRGLTFKGKIEELAPIIALGTEGLLKGYEVVNPKIVRVRGGAVPDVETRFSILLQQTDLPTSTAIILTRDFGPEYIIERTSRLGEYLGRAPKVITIPAREDLTVQAAIINSEGLSRGVGGTQRVGSDILSYGEFQGNVAEVAYERLLKQVGVEKYLAKKLLEEGQIFKEGAEVRYYQGSGNYQKGIPLGRRDIRLIKKGAEKIEVDFLSRPAGIREAPKQNFAAQVVKVDTSKLTKDLQKEFQNLDLYHATTVQKETKTLSPRASGKIQTARGTVIVQRRIEEDIDSFLQDETIQEAALRRLKENRNTNLAMKPFASEAEVQSLVAKASQIASSTPKKLSKISAGGKAELSALARDTAATERTVSRYFGVGRAETYSITSTFPNAPIQPFGINRQVIDIGLIAGTKDLTRDLTVLDSRLNVRDRIIVDTKEDQLSDLALSLGNAQDSDTITRLQERQQDLLLFAPQLETRQRQRPQEIEVTLPRLIFREPPPLTNPPTGGPKFFPKKKQDLYGTNQKRRGLYTVFLKQRGKYAPVATGLGYSDALLRGAQQTVQKLSRAFKVRQTGYSDIITDTGYRPSPNVFRTYRVRRGKAIPLYDEFIQKGSANLQTISEKDLLRAARRRY